jgi:hypothetical protein
LINSLRRAPVVLIRKVRLKRNPDIGWIGKLFLRNTIKAACCGDVRDMNGGG